MAGSAPAQVPPEEAPRLSPVATRVCRDCGIYFPPEVGPTCRACGGSTYWKPYIAPDPDWEARVKRAMKEAEYDPTTSKEYAWRRDQLLAAGYTDTQAAYLALDRKVDLHRAVAMAKAEDCGPDLAIQILT